MLKKIVISQKCVLLVSLVILLEVIIYFGYVWLSRTKENEPTWRGIIPGQTTVLEVVTIMGEPNNIITCEKWGWRLNDPFNYGISLIRPCLFAPLIYEYNEKHPDRPLANHQVYFRDGTVWMVIEDTDAYPFDDRIRNEEIIATYGWPSGQAWSRPYYRRHLIYCEQGVMFGINDIQAERVYYFEPTIFCPDEFELYLTYYPPRLED